ncbi:MAG: hypothetical protein ACRCYY_04670 [Trueperaceae bacterium]
MERAKVFRTQGSVRILVGHTVWELIGIALVSIFVSFNTHGPFYVRIVLLLATVVGSSILIRVIKFLIKPGAVYHFSAWLREDDAYYPLADTNVLPLVPVQREED